MSGQLEALLKKYKDTVTLGTTEKERTWFSSGPLSLNLAIGDARGVQSGNIMQLVGKYSSGKSTLALDIAAQHQRATGLPVMYVDFERAYDKKYAEIIGIDSSLLYKIQADTTEDGLSIVEEAIGTDETKLVIIDSIASAMPSSELKKDYNDAQRMGGNSGILSRFMNRIIPLIDNHDVLLILLNQLRANFSTMAHEKEIPYGAKSIHYATSIMVQLRNKETTEQCTEIEAIVKKNRVGSPKHKAEFVITYAMGINHALDIINLGIFYKIIDKSGSWISYNGNKVQGLDRASVEFPIDEIRQRILEVAK